MDTAPLEQKPVSDLHFVTRRNGYFREGKLVFSIDDFTDDAQATIKELYHRLQAFARLRYETLAEFIIPSHITSSYLLHSIAAFESTHENNPDMDRLVYDLQNGAISQMIGVLALWELGKLAEQRLPTMPYLAHDHAKLMRHTIIGLDETYRTLERDIRPHGVASVEKRFTNGVLGNTQGRVLVNFQANWYGNFAESCHEFGTVMKLLYGFINHAIRHTNDQIVYVRIYGTPHHDPQSICFTVGNALSAIDELDFKKIDLPSLIDIGRLNPMMMGLESYARLVAEAYHLNSPIDALHNELVGLRAINEFSTMWFHWPIMPD